MRKKEDVIQFLKFIIIGIINTLVNLSVFYILTDVIGVYYMVSAVIAFMFAVTNSFILNKTWTFEEHLNYKTSSKYFKFIVISVIALVFNLILLYVLVEYFAVNHMIAQVCGVFLNFLINFFGNKLWTFKK
ncbi:MAG: GtrA family protein [Nanoarchaeota archaeon]